MQTGIYHGADFGSPWYCSTLFQGQNQTSRVGVSFPLFGNKISRKIIFDFLILIL